MSDAVKVLDEIESYCAAASAGPWKEDCGDEAVAQDCSPYGVVVGIDQHHTYSGSSFSWVLKDADKTFIARARADLPMLAKAIRPLVDAPCECPEVFDTVELDGEPLYRRACQVPGEQCHVKVSWPCRIRAELAKEDGR